ncbi:Helix-turn-helix domain-containing protein [Streptomyces sp. 3213]|uniref:helix-turn-helix transcriptional regulator n=1 Tax=Streptomyces sp. 3213.3 TaxID=1855348 RepID=UPI00089C0D28|nr:helix-turn-helix transcriptional regulator [Streptomyces sp. 3213.3]SEC71161.1 Helix-turn-helix domain-containing protein [Streptomyces sp. 3213] [Streptomyces sp. 3213.3]
MSDRHELARFLRGRRERLVPADVGLAGEPSRRTSGLRREEVAELAHMSVDYYARLEQARGPRPSPRVLDALTGVFRLTPAERSHLFRLAGTQVTPLAAPVRTVRPHVAALLERIPDTAAIVTDATYGVIAWNPLADTVLGGDLGTRPNLARRRFLGRTLESSSAEEFAHIVVSRLRRAADRYPYDPGLARLLAELRAGSEEFRQIWETDPVHAPGHRTKTLTHPEAGPLRVNCDVLTVPHDDQQVVFLTADPGTPSARALRQLAAAGRDFSAR